MPGTQAHRVTANGERGLRAFGPVVHATMFDYDFAVTGSIASSTNLSKHAVPAGANVIGGWYKVLTTFTSVGDGATIALSLVGANDLVTAIAINDASNPWDIDLTKERPLKAIATQLVAEKYVAAISTTEVLTAGKLIGVVYWVLPEVVSNTH